ncbi:metal ABC transporter solute-binding protein, Zn/Mn family [Bacteroidota bacterium]
MKQIFLLIPVIILFSCNTSEKIPEKINITVSILPEKYFIEQIADLMFEINVLIPPGASPASYEPTISQIKILANSKVYYRIGHIGFEKAWIPKIKKLYPEIKIVNLSKNIDLIKDNHEETGVDPHIWLSPKQIKIVIRNLFENLCELFPEEKLKFEKKYSCFNYLVDSIDNDLENKFEISRSKEFIIFHPALTYLARDYGLKQYAIEQEGKEPSPRQLKSLINTGKKNNIHVIFIQKQFEKENAEIVARELSAQIIQIDPLAENWLDNITFITNSLLTTLNE